MQQNMYIMVDIGIFDNVKIMRLARKYGVEGIFALFYLWFYAARYRPEGILTGMNCEDIATAAKVREEGDEFCQTLLDVGLIEKNDDGEFEIHDWKVHNHWFTMAKERSEKARKKAEARWKKDENRGRDDASSQASGTGNVSNLAATLEELQQKMKKLEEENEKIRLENQQLNATAMLQQCSSNATAMLRDANRIERNIKEEKIRERHGASDDAHVPPPVTCPDLKKGMTPEDAVRADAYINAVVGLFSEKCPSMPKPAKITKTSEVYKQISQRIRDAAERRELRWWSEYFERAEQSDYLSGRKKDWRANLAFLTRKSKMEGVLMASYDNHVARNAVARDSPRAKGRIEPSREFGRSDLGEIGRMMSEAKVKGA